MVESMMNIKRLLLFVFILSLAANHAYGGTTGKIMGRVVDKETGEPLVGCNVMVEGTILGAATDLEGRYVILQVPPGIYNVKATYIGYHPLTISEVKIRIDQTTIVDFQLESDVIMSPTLVVVAEKKMVYKDITSTKREISDEQIQQLPNVESASDILLRQGGFYTPKFSEQITLGGAMVFEPKDPSLKGINIRGSRGGDALILIDGFPSNHPVYGGYDVMNLNVEDIENIEILTGAFSAEYGQGESAVINITTKSGGDKTHGSINYRTDNHRAWGDHYNKDRLAINLNGPDLITGKLLPKLGLKIPGKIRYYATLTTSMWDTEYDNQRIRDPLLSIGDWDVQERQDNEISGSLKVDYLISPVLKTRFSYRRAVQRWTRFDWMWNYFPNHMTRYGNDNQQIQFNITHTFSPKTFYTLTAGYTSVKYDQNFSSRTPEDFWVITSDTMYSMIKPPTLDPLTGFFNEEGYESNWSNSEDKVFSLKFDFTSQVFPEHLVKFGAQVDFKDLFNETIVGGGVGLSEYGRYLYAGGDEYPEPPGRYTAFGQSRWLIEGNPITGGVYITDKYELAGLIINAGVRMDWLIMGNPTNDPEWKAQWETATGLKADWSQFKYQVDPRFGISFPISEKTVFYFSYGHFNTLPGMENFLRDPYSGGFTGNPHLDYVTTVKNEFGLTYQFMDNWVIDVKNYNKEISGQVGSTSLKTEFGLPIFLSDNKGFTRVRGLELSLKKQKAGVLSGDLIYTLQWANGYSSSAFDDYRRSLTNLPNPIDEYRLDWDMRHQVVLRGTLSADKGEHHRLFGITIPDDWNITFQSQFYSGMPYTPGTHDPALAQILRNSQEGPFHAMSNLKIEKSFRVGKARFVVGLDIDNLFNEYVINPVRAFNVWTGEPFIYGDTETNTNKGFDYYDIFRLLDPSRFGEGRHVDFLFEVHW